jgi:hypothetical protein
MSRILKRPMFRKGGSPNKGIMTGLVERKQYGDGTDIDKEKLKSNTQLFESILRESSPKTRLPIGEFGLNLASGMTLTDALKTPYARFTKADDAREAAIGGGASKLAIAQALKSPKNKFRLLTEEEKKIKGLDVAKSYQVDSSGKIMMIGGGGTNINMAGPEKEYDKDRGKQEAKKFGAIQDRAVAAQNNITNYNLVGALSKNVNSGAYGELLLNVAKFGKRIGVNTDWITSLDENGITRLRDGVANAETMEVLQVQFALEKIQKTKGAISDKEFGKFIDTSPGLSMTPRGIEMLTIVNKALGQKDIKIAQLASEWEAANGRLNTSAETEYGKLTFNAYIAKWKEEPENAVVSKEFLQEMEDVAKEGSKDFASKRIYEISGVKYKKLKDGTVIRMGILK